MKDEGYTLAEVLAAMLILGLALGGLVEGSRLIGRMQAPILASRRDGQAARRAETELEAILALRAGDDRSLVGNAQSFQFTCGARQCGARVAKRGEKSALYVWRGEVARTFSLPQAGKVSLVYLARNGRYDRWPGSGSDGALVGVTVVQTLARGDIPLVVARSWIEHPKTCEFDAIARDCRISGP